MAICGGNLEEIRFMARRMKIRVDGDHPSGDRRMKISFVVEQKLIRKFVRVDLSFKHSLI